MFRLSRILALNFLAICLFSGAEIYSSTENTIPPPGIRESTPQVYALTGARLIIQPGQVIESGTLV
ncbi:MAG: hypothetical protein L0Y74_01030, partial [candidate division Zixibacteria bacterium]|nr:hypothetical protein [candidate division Zixibacteria bacterium]